MRTKSIILAAAVALAAPFGAVQAAPQALGLVAMDQPVPLRCEGGQCRAEFTSFCLQKARPFGRE